MAKGLNRQCLSVAGRGRFVFFFSRAWLPAVPDRITL